MTENISAVMSEGEMLDFIQRWIAAGNTRDVQATLEFYDEKAEHTSPQTHQILGWPVAVGHEQIAQTLTHMHSRAPEIRVEVLDTVLQPALGKALVLCQVAANGASFRMAQILRLANRKIVSSELLFGVRSSV